MNNLANVLFDPYRRRNIEAFEVRVDYRLNGSNQVVIPSAPSAWITPRIPMQRVIVKTTCTAGPVVGPYQATRMTCLGLSPSSAIVSRMADIPRYGTPSGDPVCES